ncbi:MAG TPA: dockerin type I repeat-containing protein [Patescibacteria group bacterium]|nr:dockerin type I repeat-containing protein [Patescibacteria group bacterium]
MENTTPPIAIPPPPITPSKPKLKFSKRTLAIIFIAIIAIAVPLTLSLISHQQDNRQNASAADCQQLTLTFAQMKASGVCNYQGSTQCTFIQNQITQTCGQYASLTPSPTSTQVAETQSNNNDVVCAEVITYGRNNTTHICQQFPTSCLPTGYVNDPTCNPGASITPNGTITPTPTCTPYPPNCIVNGHNVCSFFAAPKGGWCPITTPTGGQIACPQLAKVCPDGSTVSPTGPNCTMPACPGEPSSTPKPTPTGSVTPTQIVFNQCSALTNYYKTVLGMQICSYNQNFCNQIKTQLQTANCPIPSITPIANASITPTSTQSCALKSKGDANCDGKVNILDFNSWRDNYLLGSNPNATPPPSFLVADFNGDGGVNILDFNIWRDGFLNTTVPH